MAKALKLSDEDIARPFVGELAERYPPILSPAQLASLLHLSPKTIYDWMARGRLDGAYRKRGKHALIWRDRVLDVLFNGKDWDSHDG
ncbi:MAG: helix-turn-helix domain-containing protein [Gemmataceae bacterium]